MRDLTNAELKFILGEGRCIFCDGEEFYMGPQGGMMTNIYCANGACEAGFNVPPANVPIRGDVIRDSKLPPTERRGVIAEPVRVADVARQYKRVPLWVYAGIVLILIAAMALGALAAIYA